MSRRTPTTIHLDPGVAKAFRVKAALTGRSLSDFVNEALLRTLKEDERDLAMARKRRREKTRPYEEVVAEMKARGEL